MIMEDEMKSKNKRSYEKLAILSIILWLASLIGFLGLKIDLTLIPLLLSTLMIGGVSTRLYFDSYIAIAQKRIKGGDAGCESIIL